MIKKEELLEAIAECQGQRNPNANTCYKLASYYTILDHFTDDDKMVEKPQYSFAAPKLDTFLDSDTEFARKVNKSDIGDVLDVMDELMDTLSVINPRLYNGVMRKL